MSEGFATNPTTGTIFPPSGTASFNAATAPGSNQVFNGGSGASGAVNTIYSTPGRAQISVASNDGVNGADAITKTATGA